MFPITPSFHNIGKRLSIHSFKSFFTVNKRNMCFQIVYSFFVFIYPTFRLIVVQLLVDSVLLSGTQGLWNFYPFDTIIGHHFTILLKIFKTVNF